MVCLAALPDEPVWLRRNEVHLDHAVNGGQGHYAGGGDSVKQDFALQSLRGRRGEVNAHVIASTSERSLRQGRFAAKGTLEQASTEEHPMGGLDRTTPPNMRLFSPLATHAACRSSAADWPAPMRRRTPLPRSIPCSGPAAPSETLRTPRRRASSRSLPRRLRSGNIGGLGALVELGTKTPEECDCTREL